MSLKRTKQQTPATAWTVALRYGAALAAAASQIEVWQIQVSVDLSNARKL